MLQKKGKDTFFYIRQYLEGEVGCGDVDPSYGGREPSEGRVCADARVNSEDESDDDGGGGLGRVHVLDGVVVGGEGVAGLVVDAEVGGCVAEVPTVQDVGALGGDSLKFSKDIYYET